MLKKEAMAQKVAKFMLSDIIKDDKDNALKQSVIAGLEKSYIAGFDLAIAELKLDNTNSGYDMAEYLEDLHE